MPPCDSEIGQHRPTLLSSCARAATSEEAQFRLQYPRATQTSRIIALDQGAAPTVCRLAAREWNGDARFLVSDGPAAGAAVDQPEHVTLRACGGSMTRLAAELADAELVAMIASSDDSADLAGRVGDLCAERSITTTGLVLAEWGELDATVSRLRPNAMVMVVSTDDEDLVGLLTALRV